MLSGFPTFPTFLHYYTNEHQTKHSQTGFTVHPIIERAVTVFFVSLKTLKNMNNMKKNLLIASLLLSGVATAQFTQSNEPANGAGHPMYSLEETADPFASATGAGQTWDYSGYFGIDNSTTLFSVEDPATTPQGSNFPAATKAIVIANQMTTYINSSSTARNSQGFSFTDPQLGVVNIKLTTDDELLMNYPMALTDNLTDAFAGTGSAMAQSFPITGTITATVDGTGTLKLNSATTLTNVIRYKMVDVAHATGVPFVTTADITRTQYEYYVLGSNSNLPVFIHSTMEVSLSSAAPTPNVSVFSYVAPDGYLSVNSNELASITVYPNPATETISVNGLTADAQLTLVDAQGKTVASKAVEAGFASMDINAVNAGVYFLHVTSNDLTTVERVIVK